MIIEKIVFFKKKLYLIAALSAFLLATTSIPAWSLSISLTEITTGFSNPIGIDYHEPSDTLIMSANYSNGQPYNFEQINMDGTHTQFSNVSGLTNEIKIATVRSGNVGGFTTGDLFTGNGIDGQIMKISNDGNTVINPWVNLPGAGNGLIRGSLHVDRTGAFGGDLIVVTTGGEVWRVDSSGNPTKLVDLNTHLEGVIVVPDNVVKYGDLAGKIIVGAESQAAMYSIDTNGNSTRHDGIGVRIEDIDMINANENFFGVNFGTGTLLGAEASQFDSVVGDILLTQETGGVSGLFLLSWDNLNNSIATEAITLDAGSFNPSQWEHVTFAPTGVNEIPPVAAVPEPATMFLLGFGLAGVALLKRNQKRR